MQKDQNFIIWNGNLEQTVNLDHLTLRRLSADAARSPGFGSGRCCAFPTAPPLAAWTWAPWAMVRGGMPGVLSRDRGGELAAPPPPPASRRVAVSGPADSTGPLIFTMLLKTRPPATLQSVILNTVLPKYLFFVRTKYIIQKN